MQVSKNVRKNYGYSLPTGIGDALTSYSHMNNIQKSMLIEKIMGGFLLSAGYLHQNSQGVYYASELDELLVLQKAGELGNHY